MPTQTFNETPSLADHGFAPASAYNFDEARLESAFRLLTNADGMRSHKHRYLMEEAITTSDFPYLFGAIVDRELLARYKTWTAEFWPFTRRLRASNFNTHSLHRLDGLSDPLPEVGIKGEYLVGDLGDKRYTYAVKKRGRQIDIAWEALINDGMGAFSDIAQRMADSAINTDQLLVTQLYSSAAGPNILLFGAPIDGVTNAGVLPLTIANLETTVMLMAQQPDPVTGLPMGVRAKYLVVPPALEFTARAILTSALKQWTEVGAGGGIPVPTTNVIPQAGLQLIVNPWLPQVDTTDPHATWYLFADGMQGNAIGYGYLTGHESPEICMKASDKVAIPGGALMSPFSGDFATDNVMYRVRVVCGGTQLDPRHGYAQVG